MYRRLLEKELGVAPAEETVALYQQIQRGRLKPQADHHRCEQPLALSRLIRETSRVRVLQLAGLTTEEGLAVLQDQQVSGDAVRPSAYVSFQAGVKLWQNSHPRQHPQPKRIDTLPTAHLAAQP